MTENERNRYTLISLNYLTIWEIEVPWIKQTWILKNLDWIGFLQHTILLSSLPSPSTVRQPPAEIYQALFTNNNDRCIKKQNLKTATGKRCSRTLLHWLLSIFFSVFNLDFLTSLNQFLHQKFSSNLNSSYSSFITSFFLICLQTLYLLPDSKFAAWKHTFLSTSHLS